MKHPNLNTVLEICADALLQRSLIMSVIAHALLNAQFLNEGNEGAHQTTIAHTLHYARIVNHV